jgi:hypothetical protein
VQITGRPGHSELPADGKTGVASEAALVVSSHTQTSTHRRQNPSGAEVKGPDMSQYAHNLQIPEVIPYVTSGSEAGAGHIEHGDESIGVLQSQLNKIKAEKERLRRIDELAQQEVDLERRIAILSLPQD